MSSAHRADRRRPPKAPRRDPHAPAEYDLRDAAALQAVFFGRASEDQQRHAYLFILRNICGTGDLSYRPGDPEATAFAEGKRHVGLQLMKFADVNLAIFRDQPTEQGTTPKEQST